MLSSGDTLHSPIREPQVFSRTGPLPRSPNTVDRSQFLNTTYSGKLTSNSKILMQQSREKIRELQLDLVSQKENRQKALDDLSLLQKKLDQEQLASKRTVDHIKNDLFLFQEREKHLQDQIQAKSSLEKKWKANYELANKRQAEFERAQSVIRDRLSATQARCDNLEAKLKEKDHDYTIRLRDKENAKVDAERLEREAVKKLEHVKEENTALKIEIASISAKLNDHGASLSEKESFYQQRMMFFGAEMEELRNEKSLMTQQLQDMKNRLHNGTNELQKAKEDLDEYASREKTNLARIQELKDRVAETHEALKKNRSMTSSSENELKMKASNLNQKIDNFERDIKPKIEESNVRLNILTIQQEKLSSMLTKISQIVKSRKTKYSRTRKALESERKQKNEMEHAVVIKDQDIVALRNENQAIVKKLEVTQEQTKKMHKKLKTLEETRDNELKKAATTHEALKRYENLNHRVMAEKQELDGLVSKLRGELSILEEKLHDCENSLSEEKVAVQSKVSEMDRLYGLLALFGVADVVAESGHAKDVIQTANGIISSASDLNQSFIEKSKEVINSMNAHLPINEY